MKELIFHLKAIETLRALPKDVKGEIGKAIRDLQRGQSLQMPLSRPMPAVSVGVSEIRVQGSDGIYRAFYYLKSSRGVIVFHIFMKKTRKTPAHEIELGRRRLKEVLYG